MEGADVLHSQPTEEAPVGGGGAGGAAGVSNCQKHFPACLRACLCRKIEKREFIFTPRA